MEGDRGSGRRRFALARKRGRAAQEPGGPARRLLTDASSGSSSLTLQHATPRRLSGSDIHKPATREGATQPRPLSIPAVAPGLASLELRQRLPGIIRDGPGPEPDRRLE